MNDTPLLDVIRDPEDIRRIPAERLEDLATEIRQEMLDVISKTGGHLASNLGVVELTISLLRAFNLDEDSIVWDVGHQGYVYKLLTGRRDLFQSLRQDDGCCGFLHRDESPYDSFGAGHAGTAISAALGIAAARDRKCEDGRVIAVVGDGSLGCGSNLEGLNNIIETTDDFILILNDNKMSIAPNVGALSRYLNQIISGERYNRFKDRISSLIKKIPRIGKRLHQSIHSVEEAAKGLIVPGTIFEELGLRYIGPLDGHDIAGLTQTLQAVRKLKQPLVLHVLTEKGRGYPHAEQAPEQFHGTGGFNLETGKAERLDQAKAPSPAPSFSTGLGDSLCQLMAEDDSIVAVTAGMCQGTGLSEVRKRFPERFFDVGIAEEHAVIMAAGMATRGLKPVVAIYATFMQRAMDYVFHDVCLQNLPVIFCLDRAGIVDDGPTHHGIHDLGFWHCVPNLSVLQPTDANEQADMLRLLIEREQPGILRYPKGKAGPIPNYQPTPLNWGRAHIARTGPDVAIWALGRELELALAVAEDLARTGIEATVINPRFAIPVDCELLREHAAKMPLVILENHSAQGGFASIVKDCLPTGTPIRMLCKGWPNQIIPWGTESGIRSKFGLTQPQLVADITAFLNKKPSG